MRKLYAVATLLLVVLFFAAQVSAQDPEFGTISGSVVDQNTTEPLAMAMVMAVNPDGHPRPVAQVFTDETGNYELQVPYGTYKVMSGGIWGYMPEWWEEVDSREDATPVTVDAENNPTGINFTLEPPYVPESGSIAGTIYDASDNTPLEGATVHLRRASDYHYHRMVITGEDGTYLFAELPPENYVISAAKEGYVVADYPDEVEVAEGADVVGIDLSLAPIVYGSISGTVYDAATEGALAGAHVVACLPGHGGYRVETMTGEDGTYTLEGLIPGDYTVHAGKNEYLNEEYPDPVTVNGDDVAGIDFNLQPILVGGIYGVVSDAGTNDPIQYALVLAIGNERPHRHRSALTDENGAYAIELLSGEYRVQVYAWGYQSTGIEEPITITDEEVELNFAMSGFDYGSISGGVYDVDGEPIADAIVDARMMHGWFHSVARTGEDGLYTLEHVLPGSYHMRAFAVGYNPQVLEEPVEVVANEEVTDVNFTLETWVPPYDGMITGTITDETTTEPLVNAMVVAMAHGHGWRRHFLHTHTDSAGFYSFNYLPDRTYKILAIADGYTPEFYDGKYTWFEADPVTPSVENIDIALAAVEGGSRLIGGRIFEGQEPAGGAVVMALQGEQVVNVTATYPDGYYYMTDLEPGEYTIEVLTAEDNEASIEISVVFDDVYDADVILNTTAIDDADIVLPQTTTLAQNYPNPFNATTNISFTLASESYVELAIYDLLGRKVNTLVSGNLNAGVHTINWNGLDNTGNQVTSGIYLYSLKTADESFTNRMLLLK